jgi:hypothetical protein
LEQETPAAVVPPVPSDGTPPLLLATAEIQHKEDKIDSTYQKLLMGQEEIALEFDMVS